MQAILSAPAVPIGRIKSLGPVGEQYEVIRPLRAMPDGDWWIEINLVKTGEKADNRSLISCAIRTGFDVCDRV